MIYACPWPQVSSRHYLVKTGTEEEAGGADYSGPGENVLDCATSNSYFCRHIGKLFNREEQKEQKEQELKEQEQEQEESEQEEPEQEEEEQEYEEEVENDELKELF